MERLLERARHLRGLEHRGRPLGDGLDDRRDVHCLEVFLVQPRTRRLAGDAQDRDRIGLRRVQARHHVGAGRPRGADAHADVAGFGARIALGHVRRAFDMARQHMGNRLALAQRGVQGVDRGAGNAEGLVHAFFFQHQNGCHHGFHAGHTRLLQSLMEAMFAQWRLPGKACAAITAIPTGNCRWRLSASPQPSPKGRGSKSGPKASDHALTASASRTLLGWSSRANASASIAALKW